MIKELMSTGGAAAEPPQQEGRTPIVELKPKRIEELKASLDEDAKSSALIDFLDSVTSVEELDLIKKYITENNIKCDDDLLDFYRKNLEKWKNPEQELAADFRERFPLISKKLDTPERVRIFLRGADFCQVKPEELAAVAEPIIKEHDVEGKDYIYEGGSLSASYDEYDRPKPHTTFQVLTLYTQIQIDRLRELLFPGSRASGFARRVIPDKKSNYREPHYFISWREEKM